jgi:enoyl-CoA hydratase
MSDEVVWEKRGRRAYVTLNRPARMNAISATLPQRLAAVVAEVAADAEVRVVVLKGAGKGFCGGYDLEIFAATPGVNEGWQDSTKGPWDPLVDYSFMRASTDSFMSLFRLLKPVIARIHGSGAVAGGSDIALCCDLIVMSETAQIGYPPARQKTFCFSFSLLLTRVIESGAVRRRRTGSTKWVRPMPSACC